MIESAAAARFVSARPARAHVVAAAAGVVAAVASIGAAGAATQGDSAAGVILEARAVDFSRLLASMSAHGGPGDHSSGAGPLANVELSVLVKTAPGVGRDLRTKTDSEGRFSIALGEVPGEATIEFLVEGQSSGSGSRVGYYARPWNPAAGPAPKEIRFYEVTGEPSDLAQSVSQILTITTGRDAEDRFLRLQQMVQVVNRGFRVWLGDLRGERPASYRMSVPEGFTLAGATVNGAGVESTLEEMPHGGKGLVFRDPIFPTVDPDRDAMLFTAVLTGPLPREGETLDLGLQIAHWTEQYLLAIQEPGLYYVAPDEGSGVVALADQGLNPAMGASEKVTRSFGAGRIPDHSKVAVTIGAGKPPLHSRTILVTSILVAAVAGSIGLGRHFGRRRGATSDASAPSSSDAAARLKDLDRRLARREMTSVEYEVRKASILRGTRVAARGDGDASPRDELLRELDAIASRRAEGSEPAVARDVRVLARALRDLLRG